MIQTVISDWYCTCTCTCGCVAKKQQNHIVHVHVHLILNSNLVLVVFFPSPKSAKLHTLPLSLFYLPSQLYTCLVFVCYIMCMQIVYTCTYMYSLSILVCLCTSWAFSPRPPSAAVLSQWEHHSRGGRRAVWAGSGCGGRGSHWQGECLRPSQGAPQLQEWDSGWASDG